ncbi:TetR/AcrR family transcriptional regulator [Geodermatophilaceae bacterium NBWT11]|nr:TetR/AcrR family transcriptional regulator [Geodermatophilaceae bacterium NBWT11]
MAAQHGEGTPRTAGDGTPRRGRGRPPRVSRASIIEAARGVPAEDLSVQAVATRLGVDRSTITYHFADRDELFATLASVVLGSELAALTPPTSDRWQDWVASYATGVYDALVRHSAVAVYVRMPLGIDAASLTPVESLVQKLAAAGFPDETIGHAVAYISEVVHAVAQNQVLVARGRHPQEAELTRYLDGQGEDVAPGLRRLARGDLLGRPDHVDFAIRALVAGLEAQLSHRS